MFILCCTMLMTKCTRVLYMHLKLCIKKRSILWPLAYKLSAKWLQNALLISEDKIGLELSVQIPMLYMIFSAVKLINHDKSHLTEKLVNTHTHIIYLQNVMLGAINPD